MIDLEKYYDEYEDWDNQPQIKKITKTKKSHDDFKKKEKKVRHVTKRDLWDEYLENEQDTDFGESMMREIKKSSAVPEVKVVKNETPKKDFVPQEKKFTPRGINVHTIKNVQIDFDGVLDMQKIQNNHNGKDTYGIKFLFKSKNSTFKIIWFNQNIRERDAVFNSEFAFWRNLGV